MKKLVPMIFCHGNKTCGEEHYGICMILASHGFLVIVPNFMDETAQTATDKGFNDILYKSPDGPIINKDKTPNIDYIEAFRPKLEQRK